MNDYLQKNPNAIIVDAGNFSGSTHRFSADELKVRRRKAELILTGLIQSPGKLSAVGIGERDLAMGIDWLTTMQSQYDIPFVLSNLHCENSPFEKYHLLQNGRETMAVYSMVSPSIVSNNNDRGLDTSEQIFDGCSVQSPVDWLRDNRLDADVHLVFADLNSNEMSSIASQVDLIVETKIGKMNNRPKALDDDTVWVGVGPKGKNMVELNWDSDVRRNGFYDPEAYKSVEEEMTRKRTRLHYLQRELKDSPATSAQAKRLNRQIEFTNQSLEQLKESLGSLKTNNDFVNPIFQIVHPLNRTISDWSPFDSLIEVAKQDIQHLERQKEVSTYVGDYVGSLACKGCHESIYAQWSSTPHAKAWDTLVHANREMDNACFSCHATGAGLEGGPIHPLQISAALQGVGCESCHGSGGQHISLPSSTNIEKMVPDTVCVSCHNGVQDNGDFEPVEYRKRIVHDEKP